MTYHDVLCRFYLISSGVCAYVRFKIIEADISDELMKDGCEPLFYGNPVQSKLKSGAYNAVQCHFNLQKHARPYSASSSFDSISEPFRSFKKNTNEGDKDPATEIYEDELSKYAHTYDISFQDFYDTLEGAGMPITADPLAADPPNSGRERLGSEDLSVTSLQVKCGWSAEPSWRYSQACEHCHVSSSNLQFSL